VIFFRVGHSGRNEGGKGKTIVFSTPLIGRIIYFFANGSGTVVEHLNTDPEIAGSIPAAT
jgi:hypothetical protein